MKNFPNEDAIIANTFRPTNLWDDDDVSDMCDYVLFGNRPSDHSMEAVPNSMRNAQPSFHFNTLRGMGTVEFRLVEPLTEIFAKEAYNYIDDNLIPENAPFSPSKALTRHWIEGVNFVRKAANLDNSELDKLTEVGIEGVRKLFADRLFAEIIRNLQNSRTTGEKKRLPIFANGNSFPWLEWLLSNLFEIRPKSMSDFTNLAEEELLDYFQSSKFNGSWGNIQTRGNTVTAILSPATPVSTRIRNSEEIDI